MPVRYCFAFILLLLSAATATAQKEGPGRGSGDVTVWLSEGFGGAPGDAVNAPLMVGQVQQQHHVSSFELELIYDASLLEYNNIDLTGSLIESWDLVIANEPSAGRVLVSAASTTAAEITSDEDAILFSFLFTVKAGATVGSCGDLHLVPGEFIFNSGNPTATLIDGQLCVTPTPPPVADLSLEQTISPAVANNGDPLTLTLTVANSGPDTATGLTVSAPLTAGLTYVSDNGGGAYAGGVWTPGSLASGSSASLVINVTYNTGSTIVNSVEITASDAGDPDSTPGNGNIWEDDYDQDEIRTPVADLSLTNRVSNVIPFVGDPFTFTVTLTNNGPDPATGVDISAQLPSGLTLLTNNASTGSLISNIWSVPALSADSTATLELEVQADATGLKEFVAQVIASDLVDPDSTPNNNNPGEDDQDTASVTARSVEGAVITIRNDDAPGVGLNDPTPATPIGGNPGTTLGDQRRHAVERAAAIWAAQLVSDIEIVIGVSFEDPGCDGDAGTYAQVTPETTVRNFPNAPVAGTWYPVALANTLSGSDNNGADPEILAAINPDLSCLNQQWYLGLDGQPTETRQTAQSIDLVTVMIKELARGLGFTTQVNRSTGSLEFGTPDIFSTFVFDADLNKHWDEMSNSERLDSAAGGTLMWDGPFVDQAAPSLLNGGIHSSGHLLMTDDTGNFATYFQLNWDQSANPLQSLEPDYQGVNHEPGIAAQALFDIGWSQLGQSDLRLAMTVDNQLAVPGENAVFTLTLTNDGPEDATNVEVTDLLPGGLVYSSHSGPGSYNPANGVWTVGSLNEGDSAVLTLIVEVQNGGLKKNQAEITAVDQGDPDSSPNNGLAIEDDYDSLTIGNADVRLALSADNVKPNFGELVTLTITVTNDGPDLASGLVVRDLLSGASPAPLSYISDNGGGDYDPDAGLWQVGNLASGAERSLAITAGMNINGSVTNLAELVAADVTDPDSTPDNNVSSEDDQASITLTTPIADLALTGEFDNDRPFPSEQVELTLTLHNDGPDNASSGQVEVFLPSALTTVSHVGNYNNGIWTTPSVASGGSTQLRLTLQLNNPGNFSVSAEVTEAPENDPDSSPANGVLGEDDDVSVALASPEADLELSMQALNVTANVGDTVTFQLEVFNDGPDPATNIQIADLLPTGLAYQTHSGTGSYSSGTGIWLPGDLPVGASASLSIDAEVTIPGTKVNTAQVTAVDQDDPDSAPANNIATEDDQASATVGKADLEMTLVVSDDRPFVGDEILFTLTLDNHGPDNATNVRVEAALPDGLEFVSTTRSYSNGIWEAGQVNSGQPAQLQITARVLSIGPKNMTAEVLSTDHADPDSTPGNGSEDDFDQVTVTPQSNASATIVIVNGDGPGEGFNDGRSVSPVGGNPGTTLGQQRLNAFQHAADIWGSLINSDVTIYVLARFDQLQCSSTSGILGSAGPIEVCRDFPGAPVANTWYPVALGNAIAGTDLKDGPEIRATFNSSIDNNNGCLNNTNWYYGLDGNNGSDIDLVTVLLHEMGHGLGFLSLVNSAGQKFMGRDDSYMRHLEDRSTGKRWPQMTDAERVTSGRDTNDLHWVGPNVIEQSGYLNAGSNAQGHVEMYAPNPWQQGSSVSHFSNRLNPNELMEPSFTQTIHDPVLSVALMNDIGWTSQPLADLEMTLTASDTNPGPQTEIDLQFTVTNNGPGRTTDVAAELALPARLVYQSHDTGVFDNGTGLWEIGTLEAGDSAQINITVLVDGADASTVTGEVTNSTTEDPDSTPANGLTGEDDDVSLTITPFVVTVADLSLDLGVDNANPAVGEDINFTLTITNDGPDTATNTEVHFPIPAGLIPSITAGDGLYNIGTGIWSSTPISSGDTASMVIAISVINDAARNLVAEITASEQEDPDSTPDNGDPAEDDYATLLLEPIPVGTSDLSLSAVVDNPTPEVFDEVEFTVTMDNDGPDDAGNIYAEIKLSQDLDYVSHTGDGYDPVSGQWFLAGLTSGSQAVVTLRAVVRDEQSQTLVAEVLGTIQNDPDSSPGNGVSSEDDKDSAAVTPRYADLSLSKTVDTPSAELGETVAFTITVDNNGPDSAIVEALDQLPAGLTYVAHSGDGTYTPGTGVWQVGTLAAGDFAALIIEASVDVPGGSLNTAQITASNHFDPDSTPANGLAHEDDQDEAVVSAGSNNGAVIVIRNGDGPGEGFNDPTPVDPVGGNPGTTLGAQRLIAFQQAADIWGRAINSDVEIVVNARFNPLTCSTNSGVLGSAGAAAVARDFTGAPEADTWYHLALANALAGTDLNSTGAEINATFNSSIDNNNSCLEGSNWYYGLDGNPPAFAFDLVTVLLHEFGHGLGFSTFVNKQTGQPFYGLPDVYMRRLKDASTGKNWDQMSNTERVVSAQNTGNLVWTGSTVTAAADDVVFGRHDSGEVEMYAPVPIAPGSSVSHFSNALFPNELMEPFYTDVDHDPGLAVSLMVDIGWSGLEMADLSLRNSVDNTAASPGDRVTFTLTITNDGPGNGTGVEVTNLLPDGYAYISDNGAGSYNPATGLWEPGFLDAGSSASLQIEATVLAGGDKLSVAQVTASSKLDPDSTPDNNETAEDDQDGAAVGLVDMSISMLPNRTEFQLGDFVSLRLIVRNAGDDPATSIVISEQIPDELEVHRVDQGNYDPRTGRWDVGTIQPGEIVYLDMWMVTRALGDIPITAEVFSVDQDDIDSTPNNGVPSEDDQETLIISVFEEEVADLELTLNVDDGTPVIGQTIVVTAEIENQGPDDTSGVTASINLPAGLTLLNSNGVGTYNDATGVWDVGDINRTVPAVMNLTLRPTAGGSVTVDAEVTASDLPDSDSVPGNGNTGEDDYDEVTIVTRIAPTGDGRIVIINADGPGEGFNDPTPVAPTGGNTGTTLGQQRLNAFQHAADIWSQALDISVDIAVQAQFDPLPCSSSSGVLGSAGPTFVARDFPGATHASTWYHMALANNLAGEDRNGDGAEIRATFNSSIDNNNNCLSGTNWYYGLDSQPGPRIDLVAVLLHEFAHGLGVSTFVNSVGQRFNGFDDIYMRHLKDGSTGKTWNQMSDSERASSARDTGDLLWDGPEVTAAAGGLTAGTGAGGLVRMYAPNPYQQGSSVSHFDTALSPNELMEPFYTGPNHDPGLSLALLADEGWADTSRADLSLNVGVDKPSPVVSDTITLTVLVNNDGPDTATGVTVSAPLPASLSLVSQSGGYDVVTGVWTVGSVSPASTETLTITATVDSAVVMNFGGEVIAASPSDPDSTPGNGQTGEDDQATLTITPTGVDSADLRMIYNVDDSTPDVGSEVTFLLTITNSGPDAASGIVAEVELPPGIDYISHVEMDGVFDEETRTWTVTAIPSGGAADMEITARVNTSETAIGEAEIMAADQSDPDSIPGNGVGIEDDLDPVLVFPVLEPTADISLNLLADSTAPFVGSLAVLTLTVRNDGPETASDVEAELVLAPELDLVNTIGPGIFTGGFWSLQILEPGDEATLTIEALVSSEGDKSVTAEIVASSLADPDSTPDNGILGEDDDDSLTLTPRLVGSGALIVIDNADNPGEGFNDPTPVAPVGGNTGTTLGEQRLIAFQYAADILGAMLNSDVEIVVQSRFDDMSCSPTSGILGGAGPIGISRDFPGSEHGDTWYHQALANAIAGSDLNGSTAEIGATFNSRINNNASCLGGASWYYGLDGNPGSDFDLVSVLIHEFSHGLGFSSFVDPGTGQKFQGRDDIYMKHLEDYSTNLMWPDMTDSQRAASARNSGNLLWDGDAVTAASAGLNTGVNGDQVEMFAPNPVQPGSSVSHFSTSLNPNELMEPYYTGALHDPGMAIDLFNDLGWPQGARSDLRLAGTVDNPTPANGDSIDITLTLTNDGPDGATGIEVQTLIDSGLSITGSSGDGLFDGEYWIPGPLTSGASAVLTISATVQPGAKTMVAEVSTSDQNDPDSTPGNLHPAEDDLVEINVGNADLSLDKTSDASGEVQVGDLVTWTLRLDNAGPDTATQITVNDLLPGTLTYISSGNGYDPGSGDWDLAQLAAGASATLQITTRVEAPGTITNTALVTSAGEADPDSSPGSATGEDDEASAEINVAAPPVSNLEMVVQGFFSTGCPNMVARVQVTDNGAAVTGLNAGAFTLYEDGTAMAISLFAVTAQGEYELAFETFQPDGASHIMDLSVTLGDNTAYATDTMVSCNIAGVTLLDNGVSQDGLSGATGNWSFFKLAVPPGQGMLRFEITGGNGDADMYVRRGDLPDLTEYDYRPFQPGNSEVVEIENPIGDDWFVGLYGVETFTGLSLTGLFNPQMVEFEITDIFVQGCPLLTVNISASQGGSGVIGLSTLNVDLKEDGVSLPFSITPAGTIGDYVLTYTTGSPDGADHTVTVDATILGFSVSDSRAYANCSGDGVTEIENNQVVAPLSGETGTWQFFRINVPPGQDAMEFRIFGGSGDADLYVRFGDTPDLVNWDYRPYIGGNNETVEVTNVTPGDWYIGIEGFSDYADLSLVAGYEARDLQMTLDMISIAACPQITAYCVVEENGSSVSGLTTANFTVFENDLPALTPEDVEETAVPGEYRVTWTTPNNTGADIFTTLSVQDGGQPGSDTGQYSNCTREGGVLNVWINNNHAAPVAEFITIPVRVEPVDVDFQINSFEIEVQYDPNVLNYTGLEVAGTLVEDWEQADDSGSDPGTVRISAADVDQLALDSVEDQELIGLVFGVIGLENSCTDLLLPEQRFLFNGGSPLARPANGGFCVSEGGCPRALGDVNGDGNDAQAVDALQILNFISGIATPFDPIPVCVADTNCSGDIGLIDAVEILRKNVEIIDSYCGPESAPGRGGNFVVEIPDEQLTAGVDEAFTLDIDLTQTVVDPVYGYSFGLEYDPGLITIQPEIVTSDTLTERWGEPIVVAEPGRITVTNIFPLTQLDGTGTVLRLNGFTSHVNTGTSPLIFTRFTLASAGEPLETFGPFDFEVDGTPCFDTNLYSQLLEAWPTNTVLDILDLINCQ